MSKRLTPEQKRINWAVRRLINMHKAAEKARERVRIELEYYRVRDDDYGRDVLIEYGRRSGMLK